ncbi:MAG: DUF4434 domain-containing protein [Clostridia bacterium]|nr:DUF4434 domain-containing protein [Clostridia bacterium]
MFILLKKIVATLLAFVMALLSGFAVPEEKKCDPAFTGSFVQSWASSYWSDDQWESEMEYMKDCGLEYLVVQDLATKGANADGGKWTLYYDSSLPEFENADRSENDVLEKALYHCKKAGIKVFVPLAMFDDFWTETALTNQYAEVCKVSEKMAEEIYANYYEGYEDTFFGWYFVPEINNNILNVIGVKRLADGLNGILGKLTELDGSLPLLLSPFYTNYLSGGTAITLAQLVSFFHYTEFRDGDIYCPQDAVGAGWTNVDDLKKIWTLYSEAIKTSDADVKLWANVECFTSATADTLTDGITGPSATENTVSVPATFDRLVYQMTVASAYAENIITFSFNHYYSPKFASSMFMETYKDYLDKGFVLEEECPSAVTGLEKESVENGIKLSWNESQDNFGVAYYRIEKDGRFLARVETYAGGETVYEAEGADVSSVYTVTAFDVAGNASESVSV